MTDREWLKFVTDNTQPDQNGMPVYIIDPLDLISLINDRKILG